MKTAYKFTSETEPTDKELATLMKDVIRDVKKRAKKADIDFKKIQKIQITQAILKQKQFKNGIV